MSTSSYKGAKPLTRGGVTGQEHYGDISGTKLVWDQNGSTGWHERQAKCPEGIIRCNEYDMSLRGMGARDGMAASDHSQRSERETGAHMPPIVNKNEGHRQGKSTSEENSEDADTIVPATPNTAVNCFRTTTSDKYLTINAGNHTADDRVITFSKLRAKVDEYGNLSDNQCSKLLNVLTKYQTHLTKRPGQCTGFEYHFNIVGNLPKSATSRTIPFALRNEVRTQIQAMVED